MDKWKMHNIYKVMQGIKVANTLFSCNNRKWTATGVIFWDLRMQY